MRPVSRRDLLVLAVGLAVAGWLLVRTWYGSLPTLHWWLPAPLAVLAVAEFLAARTLKARLGALREARERSRRGTSGSAQAAARQPGEARPVEPMLVARLAVLAQASAYVGAVFAGLWTGVLLYVAPLLQRLQAAQSDTAASVVGLVCSAALVVAALRLEAACRVPPAGHDDDGATQV